MPNTIQTISDDAVIAAGDSRDVQFRILAPGSITIRSVPAHHVVHSESGFLGWLVLLRPGSAKPVRKATAHLTDSAITLKYQATDLDAEIPGQWTCQINNGTDDPLGFTTNITGFVGGHEQRTASIDSGLINLLLSEASAVASVRVHLESSEVGDRSLVSWSQAIAAVLPGGISAYAFHIDDFTKRVPIPRTHEEVEIHFRLLNLDSDPAFPTVLVSADPLSVTAVLRFEMNTAKIVALNYPVPDIDVDFYEVSVDVGFNGTMRLRCRAKATLRTLKLDVSDAVESGTIDAVNAKLADPQIARYFSHENLRSYIDAFFIRAMRLGKQAELRTYRGGDPRTVIVDYYAT